MIICDLKSNKKMCIRKAEPGDASYIVRMSAQIGGETDYFTYGEDDFYFTEEQQKAFINNIGEKDNYLYIVGIVDNKIVATLSYLSSTRRRTMHRGDLGIGVLKEYWGMGIGSSLIDYFFKWASSNAAVKKIDLEVREDNLRAINLYLKYGFKIEGRISRGMLIEGKYYDLYCMGKTIG
ncbi:MAG: family N-acetyltransferase [Clostridiales bacterium]|jgi:RimJ/RimL family protein N-acetyltransferase|nr:family N-acetyltransferase [Clostridiales bacterium]